MKEVAQRGASYFVGEERKVCNVLVGKPARKRQLG
jgi:hypothetical protein